MNVKIAELAEIALMYAREDTRRRIGAWIDQLRRWDTDPYLKAHSKKLDTGDNVYVLITSEDFLIYFSLEEDGITVKDVVRKFSISSRGQMSEANQG